MKSKYQLNQTKKIKEWFISDLPTINRKVVGTEELKDGLLNQLYR